MRPDNIQAQAVTAPPPSPPKVPTGESVVAANTNASGKIDAGGIAATIKAVEIQDPAAAERLLSQVENKLGSTSAKQAVWEQLGLPTLSATNRFEGKGEGPGVTGPSWDGVTAEVKGKPAGGEVGAELTVGGTLAKGNVFSFEGTQNYGQGTIGLGNANENVFSRAGDAAWRAFDNTVGRVVYDFKMGAGLGGELVGKAGATGSVSSEGAGGIVGVWGEATAEGKVSAGSRTAFADFGMGLGLGTTARAGVGVDTASDVKAPGAVGFVPVFAGVDKPGRLSDLSKQETEVSIGLPSGRGEGNTRLIGEMNAAGASADTKAARQVQSKFTVQQSGMISMNLSGGVGYFDGITAGEKNGTITTALFGTEAKTVGETGRLEGALGGKYTTLEDAARFMNEIGRQNAGGAFGEFQKVTPEQLAALNQDKIVEREIGGRTVQLLSNENVRTPFYAGSGGAEFREVAEGANGPTRVGNAF